MLPKCVIQILGVLGVLSLLVSGELFTALVEMEELLDTEAVLMETLEGSVLHSPIYLQYFAVKFVSLSVAMIKSPSH